MTVNGKEFTKFLATAIGATILNTCVKFYHIVKVVKYYEPTGCQIHVDCVQFRGVQNSVKHFISPE